jgi:hypothetical protein
MHRQYQQRLKPEHEVLKLRAKEVQTRNIKPKSRKYQQCPLLMISKCSFEFEFQVIGNSIRQVKKKHASKDNCEIQNIIPNTRADIGAASFLFG